MRPICCMCYTTSEQVGAILVVDDCEYMGYIPLIRRLRGLYGKLWTEFFASFYGPSAKYAGHENKKG